MKDFQQSSSPYEGSCRILNCRSGWSRQELSRSAFSLKTVPVEASLYRPCLYEGDIVLARLPMTKAIKAGET